MQIPKVIKAYGLKHSQVAERMGVSVQALRNALQSDNPKLSTLRNIANAVGCDVKEFFEDEEPKTNVIKCPRCGAELMFTETQQGN